MSKIKISKIPIRTVSDVVRRCGRVLKSELNNIQINFETNTGFCFYTSTFTFSWVVLFMACIDEMLSGKL